MNILKRLLLRLRNPTKKAPRENDLQIQERIVRRLTGRAKGCEKHFHGTYDPKLGWKGLVGDPRIHSKAQRRAYQSHMDRTKDALRLAKIELACMKFRG